MSLVANLDAPAAYWESIHAKSETSTIQVQAPSLLVSSAGLLSNVDQGAHNGCGALGLAAIQENSWLQDAISRTPAEAEVCTKESSGYLPTQFAVTGPLKSDTASQPCTYEKEQLPRILHDALSASNTGAAGKSCTAEGAQAPHQPPCAPLTGCAADPSQSAKALAGHVTNTFVECEATSQCKAAKGCVAPSEHSAVSTHTSMKEAAIQHHGPSQAAVAEHKDRNDYLPDVQGHAHNSCLMPTRIPSFGQEGRARRAMTTAIAPHCHEVKGSPQSPESCTADAQVDGQEQSTTSKEPVKAHVQRSSMRRMGPTNLTNVCRARGATCASSLRLCQHVGNFRRHIFLTQTPSAAATADILVHGNHAIKRSSSGCRQDVPPAHTSSGIVSGKRSAVPQPQVKLGRGDGDCATLKASMHQKGAPPTAEISCGSAVCTHSSSSHGCKSVLDETCTMASTHIDSEAQLGHLDPLDSLKDKTQNRDSKHEFIEVAAHGSNAVPGRLSAEDVPFASANVSAMHAYLLYNEVEKVEHAIVSVLDILTGVEAALKNAVVPDQPAIQFFSDLACGHWSPALYATDSEQMCGVMQDIVHAGISDWTCNALFGNKLATWFQQTCKTVEHLEALAATSEASTVHNMDLLARPTALVAAAERAFACQEHHELWKVSSNAIAVSADFRQGIAGPGLLCTLPKPQGELSLLLHVVVAAQYLLKPLLTLNLGTQKCHWHSLWTLQYLTQTGGDGCLVIWCI
jgi:hypothetical protein